MTVSLISDLPQELLLVSVSRIVFVHNTWPAASYKGHARVASKIKETDETIEFSVGDFQLDNMLDGAVNEVLLASTGRPSTNLRGALHTNEDSGKKQKKQIHPFLQVSIIKPFVTQTLTSSRMYQFRSEFEVTGSILDHHYGFSSHG